MVVRQFPEEFLVAFSFAGEQRDLVCSVAEEVEKELGKGNVFYDDWFESYIAGDNAELKLQEIYGKRCVLAVVCVSEGYGGKAWTCAEHKAIRARQMLADTSANKLAPFGILPIRVGDGEVDGILYNTIIPDIRGRSAAKAANLILDRLFLIRPDLRKGGSAVLDWPENPPPLYWPMANHREARAAFESLLIRRAPWRFLPIQGPSETGKSHITKQILSNALSLSGLACGRFDFKGTTDMDAEVRAFVQYLDVPLPKPGRLNERLSHILDALKQSGQPALLVFDTFERSGEAQEWIEKQLLPSLIRTTYLRVVIAGQQVPKSSGTIWETVASPAVILTLPDPPEWFDYGKQHHPDITLAFVEEVCRVAGDKITTLAQLLGPKK